MTNETKKPFYKKPLIMAAIIGIPLALAVGCSSRYHHSDRYDSAKIRYDSAKMTSKVIKRATKGLDLTDEQQAKLETLTQNVENNNPSRNQDWTDVKDQWANVITADPFDRAAFQQQWQQMGNLMNERINEHQRVITDISVDVADFIESLDVEQRNELADRIAKFRDNRHHTRHNR